MTCNEHDVNPTERFKSEGSSLYLQLERCFVSSSTSLKVMVIDVIIHPHERFGREEKISALEEAESTLMASGMCASIVMLMALVLVDGLSGNSSH